MITAFGISGTWATWDQGFQADVIRALDIGNEWSFAWEQLVGETPKFRWQGVGYPASFGPVGGPPEAPSYADSVVMGVEEHIRLLNLTPGRFVTGGYSQGAEVVGRIRYELVAGRLQHRRKDCLGTFTFGDPTRQKWDNTIGGGDGWGISGFEIPPNGIPHITAARRGDMYCTTPDGPTGDQMRAVYRALTNLAIPLDADLFTALSGDAGLLGQVVKLLQNPVGGVPALIGSLYRLIEFAATGAHGAYGPDVPVVVDFLNSLT